VYQLLPSMTRKESALPEFRGMHLELLVSEVGTSVPTNRVASQAQRSLWPTRLRDLQMLCVDAYFLGGYLSMDFLTMSFNLPSILLASFFSSLAMARQTSDLVVGSRKSMTSVPSL
jgi:hypothetical protein